MSNHTAISLSEAISLFGLSFNADASAYEITVPAGTYLNTGDGGVTNQSSSPQSFLVQPGAGGGAEIDITRGPLVGLLSFSMGPRETLDGGGGALWIFYEASAGSASLVNRGGIMSGARGGETNFYAGGVPGGARGGNATITNEAGTVNGASGGLTMLWTNSGAENATITCVGAAIGGASGGATLFVDQATAENATLIAQGGSAGGVGGRIQFQGTSQGGTSRVEIFGDGALDLTLLGASGLTIGSLEGDGLVLLGKHKLNIGTRNLSTTFAGDIQGTGSITKLGLGALTFSGVNTYGGGTTVSAGMLVANTRSGSATETGSVKVDAGALGGGGTIAGVVTIGTGSGAGSFLAPAAETKTQATLTIESALTFKSDATYTYTFKARRNQARTDNVIANGVTIESGASFQFSGQVQGKLRQGLTLSVLSNTAATPIAGTFSNLPDGAILTVRGNNFQADYEGGDGNDLTLTVVP